MFETIITPRVNETDGAGHINNTVIPIWFEAGRLQLFRLLTPDLSFASWKVALVNMNIDYLNQIYLSEDCLIETWVERIGKKSFVVREQVQQKEKICARGLATYVYYNYCREASELIPDIVRSKLENHLIADHEHDSVE